MKKEAIKSLTIGILMIMVVVLTIMYSLKFSYNNKANELIKSSFVAQSEISEYIGKLKSDTFNIYTTEQLLVGSSDVSSIDTTKIKDNDNNNLSQLVSNDDKITYNNQIFYKLDVDNFEKLFDISLYKDDTLTWYIGNSGDIKVNYKIKPIWWNNELGSLYIGD